MNHCRNNKVTKKLLKCPGITKSALKIVSVVGEDFPEPSWETDLHRVRKLPLADLAHLMVDALHQGVEIWKPVSADEPFETGKQEKV